VLHVYYIHTDHLDAPKEITDTGGNVVWRNLPTTEPFGNSPPEENPSGLGTFKFNLRHSNYYADTETGTFYAHFRDCYDPATGRFCQSDPIGLAGGSFSTYQFVDSNPLSYRDPSGLCPWCIVRASIVLLDAILSLEAASDGVPPVGGSLLKAGEKTACEIAKEPSVKYIGKLDDLRDIPRSQTLLDDLPNLGNAKANYTQNSSVLRKALRDGFEIRDASAFRPNSSLDPTRLRPDRTVGQSFLGAERNILDNKGLTLDPSGAYLP
jgi:RHS repeat-associated protein